MTTIVTSPRRKIAAIRELDFHNRLNLQYRQIGVKMTVERLFDFGEDLELRHARLYAHFSLVYGEWDHRIASFWEQMSTEEWQHYIILNFCRSLCRSAMNMQREAPATDQSIVFEALELLEQGEKDVQTSAMTLQEAFELAIRLERSEADAIYDLLIGITREVVQLLDRPYLMERIRKAQKQAEQHAEHLISAVRRFADSPSLVRQAQAELGSPS